MNRRIDFTLNLRDGFSGTIREFNRDLKGIGGGLNSMVTGAVAGVTAAVSNAVIEGVGRSMEALGNQFTKAIDREISELSGANTLVSLGVYDNIMDATEGFNKMTSNLADAANSLPGSTEDYIQVSQGIMDNLAIAYEQMGKDAAEGLLEASESMIPKLGVAMTEGGLQASDINKFINNFTSKGLTGELAGLNFAQELPGLYNKLSQNVKQFSNDEAGRVKALEKTLEEFYTDDYIASLQNTFSGVFENFKGSLFGFEGVFDFYKDLDDDLEGNQSVFEEVKGIVKALVGETGIFASIARLFNLDDDSVMNFIREGAYNFRMWLAQVKLFLLELESLGDTTLSVGELTSFEWLEGAIEFLITNAIIKPLNWIAENPIDAIAVVGKFILAIGDGLVNAFSKLSWKTLLMGAGVAAAIAGALTFLGTALGATILTVVGLIAGTITAPVIAAIAAVGLAILGIFKLLGIDLKDIWELIKKGFNIWKGLWTGLFRALTDPIGFVKNLVSDMWDRFISSINYLIGLANKIPGINIGKIGEAGSQQKSGKEDDWGFTKWANRNNKDSIHYKGASSEETNKAATLEPVKASTVNQVQNTARNLNTNTTNTNNMTIQIARIDTKANAEEVVSAIDRYVNEYNQRNMGVA